MRIETWDAAFVRARRKDIHPLIALPVERYGVWWPGLGGRVRPDGRVELRLRPPGMWRRRHRVLVTVRKIRLDLGIDFTYDGDLRGEAEFFYVDEPAGVVVNYVVRADVRGRGRLARRLARDHRAVGRAALDALKDHFEHGRIAGSEPDPALLADQRQAIAEFQAGVEAHARKLAAASDPDLVG